MTQKGFILSDYGKTKICEMPSFNRSDMVIHGFSTRVGGVGSSPYDTLNLAFHVGDEQNAVIENRKIFCQGLGTDISRIVSARQVHGTNIVVVKSADIGLGAFSYDTAIPDTDGIVTNEPGLLLATFYADCVPIFILDPVKRVIASVHAGWKGTAARIGEKAIKSMSINFGTEPSDCLVGIGPSIGSCCYEVDKPVLNVLRREFKWWQDVLEEDKTGKVTLNLWDTNRRIMVESGILSDNIELARMCTCCNQQMFFSYRGSSGVTGRMGAFLMLKNGVPVKGVR